MVMYDPNENPDPGTGTGSGGNQVPGTGTTTGCGNDANGQPLRETQIGADGNWLPYDKPECVSEEEYQNRLAKGHQTQGSGANEGGTKTTTNGALPPFNPGYKFAPVPQFNAPEFQWNEKFVAPDFNEAMKDPGYQFRSKEGLRAMEQSAAAKGNLRTGGTIKGLADYNQNLASAEYNNVYGRRFGEYGQRYGEAKDKFGFDYTGARDEYAPSLTEWLTKSAAEVQGKNLQNQNQWNNYWGNNLTAAQLWAMLQGIQ